jgi:hypothetical protein
MGNLRLLGEQLVLDQADDDLQDDPAHAAADKLTGQSADIGTARCVTGNAAKKRSNQAAATKAAKTANDGVQCRAHVGILQCLAATDAACRTAHYLNNKRYDIHLILSGSYENQVMKAKRTEEEM